MTNKPAEDPLQPHPVKEQLPGIQYCINSPPPWPEAFVLGFQHYVLTLGFSVLIPSLIVPQMGGGDITSCGCGLICLCRSHHLHCFG